MSNKEKFAVSQNRHGDIEEALKYRYTDVNISSIIVETTSCSLTVRTYLLTCLLAYLLHATKSFLRSFRAFYGTRSFITAFTSFCHLSLYWASSIQSIPPHPTSWRSILILSSHLRLGLPGSLFPSGFPTKTLYKPLLSPIRATCSSHLILLDFITRKILDEEESVEGSRSIAPLILNLDSRWWRVVRSLPSCFIPANDPTYPLNRRLGELQSRSGRFGEEKCSCPCWETNRVLSIPNPVRYNDYAIPAPDYSQNHTEHVNILWQNRAVVFLCCLVSHTAETGLFCKYLLRPANPSYNSCSMLREGVGFLFPYAIMLCKLSKVECVLNMPCMSENSSF